MTTDASDAVSMRIQSLLLLNKIKYCLKDAANGQPTALRIVSRPGHGSKIQVIDENKRHVVSEQDLPVVETHGPAGREVGGTIASADMKVVEGLLLSSPFVKTTFTGASGLRIEARGKAHDCTPVDVDAGGTMGGF